MIDNGGVVCKNKSDGAVNIIDIVGISESTINSMQNNGIITAVFIPTVGVGVASGGSVYIKTKNIENYINGKSDSVTLNHDGNRQNLIYADPYDYIYNYDSNLDNVYGTHYIYDKYGNQINNMYGH